MNRTILGRFYSGQEKKGFSGVSWDENLASWVVLAPDVANLLLRSPDVLVHERRSELQVFARAKGVGIENLLRALLHAPLAHNGSAHQATRKEFAAALRPRIEPAVEAFRQATADRLADICEEGGTVDLFEALLLPAMNAAIDRLGGSKIEGALFRLASPSQIFGVGQKMSGPRMGSLEEQVSRACARGEGLPTPVAMTLFAGDPTIGSLGETLIEQLDAHRGFRLGDIPWPARLTRTCLPFAERRAAKDIKLDDVLIRRGDRIAIYLGAFHAGSVLHYGAGAHTCLGKSLAEQLWTELRSSLLRRGERIELISVAYREADFAFTMPIEIMSRITK